MSNINNIKTIVFITVIQNVFTYTSTIMKLYKKNTNYEVHYVLTFCFHISLFLSFSFSLALLFLYFIYDFRS